MTAEHIIGIYVVIDDTMRALGHTSHRLAGVSDAEVLTVAVVAAAFFGNHHARALAVLRATGYLSRALSTSRFSRRVHALADWLALLLDVLSDLFAHGQAVICATGGGLLVPLHKDNMVPNTRAEQCGLRTFRLTIETVNSQLTAMGLGHLHVRSVAGLEIKVHASLLALACLNLD